MTPWEFLLFLSSDSPCPPAKKCRDVNRDQIKLTVKRPKEKISGKGRCRKHYTCFKRVREHCSCEARCSKSGYYTPSQSLQLKSGQKLWSTCASRPIYMEPRRPAPENVPQAPAEIENTPESSRSGPSTTESQLVALLSESRREAESLRQELAAVRKKADADHRRLEALSIKSPDHQVRVFQERLARAEAALEEAETRSRFVERNWLQVERYLTIIQHQAADSRAAFSRLMEEDDGRLVLPTESLPARRRDTVLLKEDSLSTSSHSPQSPDYMRPPLITPRRPPSPYLRSPSGIEDERWHVDERGNRSPPYKRHRVSGRGTEFRPRSSRSPSPSSSPPGAFVTSPAPGASSQPRPRADAVSLDRRANTCPRCLRFQVREPTPFPFPIPPYRPTSETLRAYDARNPPLQFIQHRHPPAPPRPPTPQAPPAAADAGPHQYQHRFHLNTAVHGHRRPVRPGAYETVVFALDSDVPAQGVGGPGANGE
ncbi:hypothetical protein MVEN_02230700 [Mycena venus]|uniref:Uncharacterized protein n=1 Tax=Mycena venus TaxID=2733690 RepID=A0A8H6X813_9AGAR|nr:hypothetical protein MVEN_02230700 [Mycena venus]